MDAIMTGFNRLCLGGVSDLKGANGYTKTNPALSSRQDGIIRFLTVRQFGVSRGNYILSLIAINSYPYFDNCAEYLATEYGNGS